MSEPRPPALVGFRPPCGACFASEKQCQLAQVSRDLCKIAAHLQSLELFGRLARYDDWYNHDELYFERGPTDFHGLFQLVQTPRDLLAATPDDDYVHVGVVPEDRRWYLRFRAEWDDQGELLVGAYSLTLGEALCEAFEAEIVPTLESPIRRAAPDEEWASSG
jgi:hypothetical protein